MVLEESHSVNRGIRLVGCRVSNRSKVRLEERTRIARELHDTLLQGCLSASMQLDIALDHVPDDLPVKGKLTHLHGILTRVVDEGRNALRGLRAVEPAAFDLEHAIQRAQQEVAQGEIAFRIFASLSRDGSGRCIR